MHVMQGGAERSAAKSKHLSARFIKHDGRAFDLISPHSISLMVTHKLRKQ
jgi:hypothetical protein